MNLKPALATDHPHRRLCLLVLERVSKTSLWAAYKAGILGAEMVEMAVKAAAFDVIASQGTEKDCGTSIANAILLAIGVAQGE